MSKDRFVELLKQAGYGSVQLEKGVVRIYIVGDKKDLAQAYKDITLFILPFIYKCPFSSIYPRSPECNHILPSLCNFKTEFVLSISL